MKYLSLQLKNVHFFKDVTFDFDHEGTTVILGLNRDSKTENTNTNGAGKSSMLNSMLDVLTPEGGSSNRKDRTKAGERIFTFSKGSSTYKVINTFGKSEKLDIERNGVSLGIHSLAEAKARLLKITGKDLTDYRVLEYLDVGVPHPLQLGTSSQRKAFFTKFFSLAGNDYVKKLVKAELDELKSKEMLLKELTSNLAELKAEYTSISLSDKDFDVLVPKAEQLVKSYESESAYADWCETYKEELVEYVKYMSKDLADLKAKAAVYQEEVEAQKDYKSAMRTYQEYLEDKEEYDATNAKFADFDVEEAEATLESLEAKRSKASKLHKKYVEEYADYKAKYSDLSTKIEDLEDRLSSTKTVCPTCGTKLSSKEEARSHIAAETKLQKSKLSELQKPTKPETDLEAIEAKVETINKKLRAYARRPSPPKLVKKPVKTELEYDPAAKLSRVEHVIWLRSKFDKEPRATRYAKEGLQKNDKLEDAKLALYDLVREQQQNAMNVELRASLRSKAKECSQRISKLKEELSEVEVLEVLTKAYGTRSGVKELVIKSICQHLEATVNKYAKYIFPEPFTFEFDLQSTNFDIRVSRPYKNKVITSDVRKLSGAERSMFNMTLALSLLTFVPKVLRSNVLILDEVDANFSEEMQRSFAKFIPVLNKVIPHLIIITPNSDKENSGARYFTVVKQNGTSSLIEGKVLK